VTTIAGSLIPAGGLLAAFGSLLSGVRDDRRRVRALLIVAVCSFALQVAFVAFAVWGPDPGLRLVPRRSGDLPDLVDGLTR
jgi:predicted MFS family arabinose efflux permease